MGPTEEETGEAGWDRQAGVGAPVPNVQARADAELWASFLWCSWVQAEILGCLAVSVTDFCPVTW